MRRKTKHYTSDNTRENTAKRLWLLIAITVSLIGFHWAIRPKSELLSLYLLGGTLAMFAITFGLGTNVFWENEPEEPLSFTDGISLWPTLLLQIIAILWACAFFIVAISELDSNFRSLSRRHFPRSLPHFPACPPENEPDECELWLSRLRSLSPWPFFALTVTIVIYAYNDVYPSVLIFYACLAFLALPTLFYLVVIEGLDDVSIGRWMKKNDRQASKRDHNQNSGLASVLLRLCIFFRSGNGSANPPGEDREENHGSVLWREYYNHGLLGHRIARVVGMWLIFAIIETLLVYLLPPWPLPWRGTIDWASSIDLAPWTGVLSFVVIMLLLFFILDAVRLNFYWIKKLRKQHPLLKESIAPEDVDPYQATRTCPAESLEDIVSLVAERTRAVDKLIYYPMLCIMLMLFAKITYFDNQDFPLSKALTFGVAISVLFFSGFMLRHEANELKLSVKKSLNRKCTEEITDKTTKKIDAIDEGAFQPMLEQPVMQALLIILASIGLFAGEYLKLFG